MQTYPTKSGRTYFFAGLLFALILGAYGYWMLHKEQILVEIHGNLISRNSMPESSPLRPGKAEHPGCRGRADQLRQHGQV